MLVDETPERARLLREALDASGHQIVAQLKLGDDVVGQVEKLQPDVIIVDLDSPDRDTLEGMRAITKQRPRPIVMFTNNDDVELMESAVRAGVSAYVVDGMSPKRILPILKTAMLRFALYEGVRRELDETRIALADRKIIDRAKGILMQQRGLSEDAAYKLLRKGAMDRSLKLAELARGIVNAAELLG
jgi:two-component system, response regulator / RNA-binding antiterminator